MMYETPPDCETVFRTRERGECLESHLVLEAVGISAQVGHQDGWWLLVVSRSDLEASAAELEAYRRENADRSARRPAVPVFGGAVAGVWSYAGAIVLVAGLAAHGAFGLDWRAAGAMQAGEVMAGEWWRSVTALTLHLDAGHIVANLVFGAVFGLLAGRVFGGGVAWLAIVLAGSMGNVMNAAVQSPRHVSIGASTAVFAALGLIVAHALRPRMPVPETWLKRWSPLIGGGVLLAFTGVGGARTDVVAHVTGCFAGMLIGWSGCRLPARWLASRAVQAGAGIAAVILVAFAWAVGLLAAR